jgi:hypothetical protein
MGEYAGNVKTNIMKMVAPDRSIDVELAIRLKEENKAFKVVCP